MIAALLALSLAAAPPHFERIFSFWIGPERVGAVQVRFDGARYRYASTTVVRRGDQLETRSFSCQTDAAGLGRTDDGHALPGPLPSTAALWLFAEGAPRACLSVEDERDGHPGQVCAERRGSTLRGTLLGEPFTAELADDGGPSSIALPGQRVRFLEERGALPLPHPRDLFGRGLPAGALAALGTAAAARLRVVGEGCDGESELSRSAPAIDVALPASTSTGTLAEVAREATRGVGTSWSAARHLAAFVDAAVASAEPELDEHDPAVTWKRRRGGCVGHAAVFQALAGSLGLRTRTVYGALLEEGALHPHAWSEVEVGGRYFALDPSRGGAPLGPDHIPLARSDDPDPLRAGRCLLALPQLQWTILELRPGPR